VKQAAKYVGLVFHILPVPGCRGGLLVRRFSVLTATALIWGYTSKMESGVENCK